jgi:hypothetical protein
MNKKGYKKKTWLKPVILALNIKKDTFSGSIYGPEDPGHSTAPGNPKPH